MKVLLLDGVDTIKYLTYNSDAFQVSKVYNTLNKGHTLVELCCTPADAGSPSVLRKTNV